MEELELNLKRLQRMVHLLVVTVLILGMATGYLMFRMRSGTLSAHELILVDHNGKTVAQLGPQELIFRDDTGQVNSYYSRDGIGLNRVDNRHLFKVSTGSNDSMLLLSDQEGIRLALTALRGDATWLAMSAPGENDRQLSLSVERDSAVFYMNNSQETSQLFMYADQDGPRLHLSQKEETVWKAP